MEANADPLVQELRDRISALHRELFRIVNERLELVARLKQHKDEQGYAFVDPQRERDMVDEQVAASSGRLSADGLRRFHAELLALTKREL
jgi:3-deoxy-7-phosphoheptulonate synthase/chorismate mutase